MNGTEPPRPDDLASLQLLHEIQANPGISQREISRRVGVSLGLTNLLIRRMVSRAWIKIRTVPGRRLLYALTPRGLAEKFRKTRDFLRLSVRYYGTLKESIISKIRESKLPRPRVSAHAAGELSGVVAEAVVEAGGVFVPHGDRPQLLLTFAKPSRAEREVWERDGVLIIDLS